MTRPTFIGLEPPEGKYKEIFDYILRPDPGNIKAVDLCCGLGFGKTDILIQVAALVMDHYPGSKILFLEPDWDRVSEIFWEKWEELIPAELYTFKGKGSGGANKITWYRGGSTMIVRPRVITGNKADARSKKRGIEFSLILDDEAAIHFDLEQYQNQFGRIRIQSPVMGYITASTPLVGPYGRFLSRKSPHKIFKGRTADNVYLLRKQPDYEKRLRAEMSPQQARRELDAELVALEGRIWKTAVMDKAWPAGNVHHQHRKYDPTKPWWVFSDFGAGTGSFLVVQQADPIYRGRRLFGGPVWVAVADLCPHLDASATRAFGRLDQEFGSGNADARYIKPAGVTGGADMDTRDTGSGKTISDFARQVWPNVRLYPCDEKYQSKQQQYDCLDGGFYRLDGHRRFCVAKDFVSLDQDSCRGLLEMIEQDQFLPIEERGNHPLPKKPNIPVQHIRDAVMMGAAKIMFPPQSNTTLRRVG
jgi:hypothetical protein